MWYIQLFQSRSFQIHYCPRPRLFHFFKNCTFLFMYHIFIRKQRHLWTLLFFEILKLWQPVTLLPLEAQGHILHFWKPPIYICLEPDCQGDCSVLKVCQVMLKSLGLLSKLLYVSDFLCTPLHSARKGGHVKMWNIWFFCTNH